MWSVPNPLTFDPLTFAVLKCHMLSMTNQLPRRCRPSHWAMWRRVGLPCWPRMALSLGGLCCTLVPYTPCLAPTQSVLHCTFCWRALWLTVQSRVGPVRHFFTTLELAPNRCYALLRQFPARCLCIACTVRRTPGCTTCGWCCWWAGRGPTTEVGAGDVGTCNATRGNTWNASSSVGWTRRRRARGPSPPRGSRPTREALRLAVEVGVVRRVVRHLRRGRTRPCSCPAVPQDPDRTAAYRTVRLQRPALRQRTAGTGWDCVLARDMWLRRR